jgi:hypothetical protein
MIFAKGRSFVEDTKALNRQELTTRELHMSEKALQEQKELLAKSIEEALAKRKSKLGWNRLSFRASRSGDPHRMSYSIYC